MTKTRIVQPHKRTSKAAAPASAMPALALYEQVKEHITRKIQDGSWPAGHRLPSEHELVAQFGISRMTANRALRELVEQGRVVRVAGVGSFVAEDKPQSTLLQIANIASEIRARGHDYGYQLVSGERVAASADVAAWLDLRAGESVFHSVCLHLEDGVPVQLEDRYVNPRVAPDYIEQDFSRETPNAYLSRVAPLTAVEHTIEAILPDARVAGWLELKTPQACLQVLRRTWSGEDVVTFARLIHPGDRYRLTGHAVMSTRPAPAKIPGDQAS